MKYEDHRAVVDGLEALLRRARAVIPNDYEDEIEVRAAINRALNDEDEGRIDIRLGEAGPVEGETDPL